MEHLEQQFLSAEKSKENEKTYLEKQFQNPKIFGLEGAEDEIEIFDIIPHKAKTNVPMLFISGWSGTPHAYKENILSHAKFGRRVISSNTPHGIEAQNNEQFPNSEMRKVVAAIKTLEACGIEKVDAVGHSEGAIDVVMAAVLYPEKFRNIVLVNPGGLQGKDSLW
ncbi:alpha/beta hydrolase [Patescibacteria group bacterium]|nr:alpha/beta hydrolase [Patescibacteria group bacterium]